jgi:hypothetical protein
MIGKIKKLVPLTSCQAVSFGQVDCRVQESQEDEATNRGVSSARVLLVDFLLQVVADHVQRPRKSTGGKYTSSHRTR